MKREKRMMKKVEEEAETFLELSLITRLNERCPLLQSRESFSVWKAVINIRQIVQKATCFH